MKSIAEQHIRKRWGELLTLSKQMGISPTHDDFHLVIRKFGINLIREQNSDTNVIVGDPSYGTTRISFSSSDPLHREIVDSSKEKFLHRQAQEGTYAEEALLYVVLYELGYFATVQRNDITGTMIPFSQPYAIGSIDMVNLGVQSGGVHWRLVEENVRGDGNCGTRTIAKRIEQDFPTISLNLKKTSLPLLDMAPKEKEIMDYNLALETGVVPQADRPSVAKVAAISAAATFHATKNFIGPQKIPPIDWSDVKIPKTVPHIDQSPEIINGFSTKEIQVATVESRFTAATLYLERAKPSVSELKDIYQNALGIRPRFNDAHDLKRILVNACKENQSVLDKVDAYLSSRSPQHISLPAQTCHQAAAADPTLQEAQHSSLRPGF